MPTSRGRTFFQFVWEQEQQRHPWLLLVEKCTGQTHSEPALLVKRIQKKKGPGRGWWAPPKGTHVGAVGKRALSKGARKAIKKYTRSILAFGKNTGKENATTIDKNGNPTGTKWAVGSRDEVDITGLLTGEEHILIHNHPSNNSFSAHDIALLFTTNIQHMIAAGHDGTLYKISKTPNTRALTDEPIVVHFIQTRWNKTMLFLLPGFTSKVKSGKLSRDAAQKEHTHQIVAKVAETYGLDYERIVP